MPGRRPDRLGRWLESTGRLPRTVAGMDALPAVHPRSGLPARVSVYEVGPRDGLQAEKAVVPLPVKLELIDRLGEAGLTVIEATSFVSPRWVPQLADADELMASLRRRPGVRYPVLVPNQKGFERAMAAGADELLPLALNGSHHDIDVRSSGQQLPARPRLAERLADVQHGL